MYNLQCSSKFENLCRSLNLDCSWVAIHTITQISDVIKVQVYLACICPIPGTREMAN